MTKISDLLSKPVISIFDAKIIGTIGNIYFDEKMAKGIVLSVFNDDTSETEEKFIEIVKLVSIDNEAAVIKSSDCVTYEWNTRLTAANPINSPAYTQDGKLLGTVRDIILDGIKIVSFVVDSREIAAETLLSHSGNILIFNDTGKPIKPPPKKKIPKELTYQKIQLHYPEQNPIQKAEPIFTRQPPVQNTEPIYSEQNQVKTDFPASDNEKTSEWQNSEKSAAIYAALRGATAAPLHAPIIAENHANATGETPKGQTAADDTEKVIGVPQRIPQSATSVSRTPMQNGDSDNTFDFLIGKLLQKNICTASGQVLVRANTVITEEVIGLCKTESRLVQLALHSLTL